MGNRVPARHADTRRRGVPLSLLLLAIVVMQIAVVAALVHFVFPGALDP